MSLLGLDIGTTGCKATVLSSEGKVLGQAYQEYHLSSPEKGWLEMDSQQVWNQIKIIIKQVTAQSKKDPVKFPLLTCSR